MIQVKNKKVKSKRIFLIFSLIFVVQFSLFTVFAQAPKAVLENQTKLVKEFDVNGLKVLVKQRASSPTVAAGLFLRGGVSNLTAQNAGIEDLMLETMTIGSKNFPREMLRKELSKTGSNIGSGVNYDYSVISFGSTRQNFQRSWEIFTDVVMNPTFVNEDLELAREKMLTVLRDDEDTPESFLEVLESKIVYANHPYSNDARGTVETISKLKAEDLRAYHKEMLKTSRLLLVVVGDVNADELQKNLMNTFGKLERGNYQAKPLPALEFTQPTVDITERALETNYLKGVFAAPNLGNPDYYAMRVAITILQQRVYQEVRVRRQLSYAPGADMASLSANTGNISVSTNDVNLSVAVMLAEIDGLKNEAVPKEDLDGMAGYFLTTYFLKLETNAAQAADLALYELTGNGWRNSANFLEGIKKVTPDDIQRVSKKYMKNLRFIVIGNPKVVNKNTLLQK
jgi:predicted Zn-dependent peptidase